MVEFTEKLTDNGLVWESTDLATLETKILTQEEVLSRVVFLNENNIKFKVKSYDGIEEYRY